MPEANPNARLEAFSDGVFAFALTLLVVDIKIPSMESIAGTAELWRALQQLTPLVCAFLLSFGVIFITWFNHRGTLRLVSRSSSPFIYANGFMLLTVVFIPFPTALLGAYVFTDHATPAVVLYDAVLAVQAIAWMFVTRSALGGELCPDARCAQRMRVHGRNANFGFAFYTLLAVAALWLPQAVAVVTTASWIAWLAVGIRTNDALQDL